jgi:hypothetical protein
MRSLSCRITGKFVAGWLAGLSAAEAGNRRRRVQTLSCGILEASLKEARSLWTVIYIAPNRTAAENLKGILQQEGIMVSLRATGLTSSNGNSHVEIMVPKGEAAEAHQILSEALGRGRYGSR